MNKLGENYESKAIKYAKELSEKNKLPGVKYEEKTPKTNLSDLRDKTVGEATDLMRERNNTIKLEDLKVPKPAKKKGFLKIFRKRYKGKEQLITVVIPHQALQVSEKSVQEFLDWCKKHEISASFDVR